MTTAQALAWAEDFGEHGVTLPPPRKPVPFGFVSLVLPWQDCPCGSDEHQFGGHGALVDKWGGPENTWAP